MCHRPGPEPLRGLGHHQMGITNSTVAGSGCWPWASGGGHPPAGPEPWFPRMLGMMWKAAASHQSLGVGVRYLTASAASRTSVIKQTVGVTERVVATVWESDGRRAALT